MRQRQLTGDGMGFSNFKALTPWHTASTKGTPPNSSQTVPPSENQVFKHKILWQTFSFKPSQCLCVFITAIAWQVVSYKWNLGSYNLSVFLACKVGLLELFKPCTQAITMWVHSGHFSVCVIRYHDQENLKKEECIWFIYSPSRGWVHRGEDE